MKYFVAIFWLWKEKFEKIALVVHENPIFGYVTKNLKIVFVLFLMEISL